MILVFLSTHNIVVFKYYVPFALLRLVGLRFLILLFSSISARSFGVLDTVVPIWTKVLIVPRRCSAALTSLPLALPETHNLKRWQAEKSGQGELEAAAVQVVAAIVDLRWGKWRRKNARSKEHLSYEASVTQERDHGTMTHCPTVPWPMGHK